jgi:hypothetical protein
LWLNEALTVNTSGVLDNAGEREPWIELLNAGPLPVSLQDWYLTDSLADLTRWAFPAGSALWGQEWFVLWADGQPLQTVGDDLHLSFQLANQRTLALVREQPGGPAVVDYLTIPTLANDTSVGALPDAQGFERQLFGTPTPRAPNAAVAIPRLIATGLMPPGGLALAWAAVPGVRYQVEAASALSGTPWETVGDLYATDEAIVFSVPASATRQFYRVVVPW